MASARHWPASLNRGLLLVLLLGLLATFAPLWADDPLRIDLSATPFYLQNSGYPAGSPFPWLVSDFGLVDAIESGIVKIPRLPVRDDSESKDDAGRPDPQLLVTELGQVADHSPRIMARTDGTHSPHLIHEAGHAFVPVVRGSTEPLSWPGIVTERVSFTRRGVTPSR